MTIHVATTEHGTQSYPDADGWETLAGELGDEGNLSITKSEDDEYYEHTIAEFAKGAWLFVYETVDQPEPKEPRVFQSIHDVPVGVRVLTRQSHDKTPFVFLSAGNLSHQVGETHYSWDPIPDDIDLCFAPYREVLA